MLWKSLSIGVLLSLSAAACAVEELPPGHFPCGNGSCEIGKELCVVDEEDGCTNCVPLPEPCEDDNACGCLDDVDTTMWELPCATAPSCDDESEGLVITCLPDGWGCG